MPGWCLARMAPRQQRLPGMGKEMRINEAALLILMRPLHTAGCILVVTLWNAPDTWKWHLWYHPLIRPSQIPVTVWNWLVYSRSVKVVVTSIFFLLVTEFGISFDLKYAEEREKYSLINAKIWPDEKEWIMKKKLSEAEWLKQKENWKGDYLFCSMLFTVLNNKFAERFE